MATLEQVSHRQVAGVALAAGDLRLVVVPRAGMIGCSLKHRGAELLVQRGGLDAWRGTGKSFGLPLLHPFANRLRDWRYAAAGRAVTIDRSRGTVRADEHDLPIHGALAAAEDWDVTDRGADADAAWIAASLDYARRDDRLAVFPFPHRVELELRLDAGGLTVATAIVPTGAGRVPLAFGWHPWLSLPDVPRGDWELGLPERQVLPLDEQGLPTGERSPARAEQIALGDRALDAHCAVGDDARFTLTGGGRELAVEWAGGYRYAQVFAPTNLDVVCVEPMMAPVAALSSGDDLRVVAPGERASATFRLRVT